MRNMSGGPNASPTQLLWSLQVEVKRQKVRDVVWQYGSMAVWQLVQIFEDLHISSSLPLKLIRLICRQAASQSLLHRWEARTELPATQRVGLLFQKDFFTSILGDEDWQNLLKNVGRKVGSWFLQSVLRALKLILCIFGT